jgi:DNA-binding NarL/FixJ family response regulator
VNPIRIILVDNHPIVRSGIRAELETIPSVIVAGEANDGREALGLLKRRPAHVVFMDISMPGLNGLETTMRISKEFPNVRVVILSRHEDEQYFWHALKAGAVGYLIKRAAVAEIRDALQRVMAGEIYVSPELSRRMAKALPPQQTIRSPGPLEHLSARQREILQLIAEGHSTKAIATVLKLSPKTIEYHRAQLMGRLRIHDVPGLVRFALRCGVIVQGP